MLIVVGLGGVARQDVHCGRTRWWNHVLLRRSLSVPDSAEIPGLQFPSRMICGVRGRLIGRLRENVSYTLQKAWGVAKVDLRIYVRARKNRLSRRDLLLKSSYDFDSWGVSQQNQHR